MNSGIVSFLPMILIPFVFYFILIRPQQIKQRELRQQLDSLRRGDRVKTAGGIIGTVQMARDGADEIDLEIAPGVKVQVARDAISSVLSGSVKPSTESAKK